MFAPVGFRHTVLTTEDGLFRDEDDCTTSSGVGINGKKNMHQKHNKLHVPISPAPAGWEVNFTNHAATL